MNTRELTVIVIVMTFSIYFCNKCSKNPLATEQDGIYHNSFETRSDIAGFRGQGDIKMVNQAAPKSGNKSLYVSGGCIVPHAYDTVFTTSQACSLVISCWGKSQSNGGMVLIYNGENKKQKAGIPIKDLVWTYYRSEKALGCRANSSVVLEFMSGGFVPSSMLIDNLEIIATD